MTIFPGRPTIGFPSRSFIFFSLLSKIDSSTTCTVAMAFGSLREKGTVTKVRKKEKLDQGASWRN